jgi:hypothetical protein
VTSHRIPEHRTSHDALLDRSPQSPSDARFDAILVPTNRQVETLQASFDLASQTSIPLIVVCSKRVDKDQVIKVAMRDNVEVFAVDFPQHPVFPESEISFTTSTDEDILKASFGKTRDLSMKRNLGLAIAWMLRWQRLMFLDDDIFDVSKEAVGALAAALNDHNVSVLIPDEYEDNSVVCHANRLGGGAQGKFASGGSMGVRCYRDDLPFFPNIYNEDWFFFSEEAASRKIARIGESQQRWYDAYRDPQRAVKEEFGDLLAEGLYARLDEEQPPRAVDRAYWDYFDLAYWDYFIDSRRKFLRRVANSLTDVHGPQVRAARESVEAAQRQLGRITPELCQNFIRFWREDLTNWRDYLTRLPRQESVESSLEYLDLDYAVFSPSTR